MWRKLESGLGRIADPCTAKTDIVVASVDITGFNPGDRLMFGEPGAYDWSMSSTLGAAAVIPDATDDHRPA